MSALPTLHGASPAHVRAFVDGNLLKRLLLVLVGSWVIALSARISVPMWPVPMTMQTAAVLLVAALGGRRLGVETVLAYLAQGAAGLPMFAGGAGLAYMAGTTGGYLAGFLVAAFVVGHLADRGWNARILTAVASILLGHLAIFVFGVAWLQTFIGWSAAFVNGVTPFLPGLVLKTGLVVAVIALMNRTRRT